MSLHIIHFLTTKIHKLLYHTPKQKKTKKKPALFWGVPKHYSL